MWIVIDGPEKAGKSTTAQAIVQHVRRQGGSAKYRHFSGSDPVTIDALEEIMDDLDEYTVVVWDRSWASGEVYESLGFAQKDEAIRNEGERLFASLDPIKLMLIGPSAEELQAKRTPDDLPVAAALEREVFKKYAREHGWPLVRNLHNDDWTDKIISFLGF